MDTAVRTELGRQTPDRLRVAAQAMREGFTVETINEITGIDPWFLRQIEEIVGAEDWVKERVVCLRRRRNHARPKNGRV